jgi:signal transduction histidine kinase
LSASDDRRRIERALHDGVQQDLVAVSVRLQLVRLLAGHDLPAAVALLDEIGTDVLGALERVQTLANEIYPSVLDARGLPDAIRGAASAARIAATVEADGLGRYPAEVEAAVYFCCQAVLAALAPETRVTIRIRKEEQALRVEVAGDTAGVEAETLLRERIEALGAVLSVEAAPGGGPLIAATVPTPRRGRG